MRIIERINIVLLRLIHQWAEDAERRAARRFLARINAERAEEYSQETRWVKGENCRSQN